MTFQGEYQIIGLAVPVQAVIERGKVTSDTTRFLSFDFMPALINTFWQSGGGRVFYLPEGLQPFAQAEFVTVSRVLVWDHQGFPLVYGQTEPAESGDRKATLPASFKVGFDTHPLNYLLQNGLQVEFLPQG